MLHIAWTNCVNIYCVCMTDNLVFECNGWDGIVSNKYPGTHPRQPYLPSSAQGIERAIFSLQIHLFSLSIPRSLAFSLSVICLVFIHSASLPLCLHIFPFFSRTFLLWRSYQVLRRGGASGEETYSMSSDRCLTQFFFFFLTQVSDTGWDRAMIKRKCPPTSQNE